MENNVIPNQRRNISSSVELVQINLVSTSFNINVQPDLIDGEQIQVARRYGFRWGASENVLKYEGKSVRELFCFVTVEIKGTTDILKEEMKSLKDGIVIKGACTFVVRYHTDLQETPTEDEMKKFLRDCALPHAYPYIRNHVDSTMVQMGVSGIVMPIHRIKVGQIDRDHVQN